MKRNVKNIPPEGGIILFVLSYLINLSFPASYIHHIFFLEENIHFKMEERISQAAITENKLNLKLNMRLYSCELWPCML